MKINGSEVKTKEENGKSKKTKKSSGNTSIAKGGSRKKSASADDKALTTKGDSRKKSASADDAKTLSTQGILGLVIAAVLVVCIILAVVFGVRHIGKYAGGTAKDNGSQTVAEQLSGKNNGKSTEKEEFPDLTNDTAKNDNTLKEWEKKSSDEGDDRAADYYRRLQGTGLKQDDVSSRDAYVKVASGVVEDLKTLSCDDFYAKYSKVPNKNCEVYGTIQDSAKKESPKYSYRYSDNTKTWLTYTMDSSNCSFTVYVLKDSVVSDVQFAFITPLK